MSEIYKAHEYPEDLNLDEMDEILEDLMDTEAPVLLLIQKSSYLVGFALVKMICKRVIYLYNY